jgi:hypothetical protein
MEARAELLQFAPPDAVPVFDGVFLLRPQLNDVGDLRILLEVDFQETLGCHSRMSILSIRAQGAMLPHGLLLRPFPMGLGPAVVSPRVR